MGEIKKQKQLITVPEANNNFKGLGFRRWDAFVSSFLAEHPEYRKENAPTVNGKHKKEKKNDR